MSKKLKAPKNNKEALQLAADLLKLRADQLISGYYGTLDKKGKKKFFSDLIEVVLCAEEFINKGE